jgi:hypothetical protein
MRGASSCFHYTDDLHPTFILLVPIIFLGFHLDGFAVFSSTTAIS